MSLVDDINLVAIARRPIREILDDRTGVIDLAIGRAVDLRDVERTSGANLDTRWAFAARRRRRPPLAVKASREDARGGRLADPADSGEEERMRDSSALERLDQRARDVFLANQFLEPFRTPFARQHQMRGRTCSHRLPL